MKLDVIFQESKQSFNPQFGEVQPIHGKDGIDGKTPVKGVDYFTESDKAEMVTAVIAALPVYGGET